MDATTNIERPRRGAIMLPQVKSSTSRNADRSSALSLRITLISSPSSSTTASTSRRARNPEAGFHNLQLSDPDRTDHIPALLQLTVELLARQGENIRTDHQTAPRRHGERRYKQGYASAWLVREAKLLQDAIGDCIQRNLLEIELSMLTPDMVRAFGILQMFVEQSLNAFQEKAESPKNRRK